MLIAGSQMIVAKYLYDPFGNSLPNAACRQSAAVCNLKNNNDKLGWSLRVDILALKNVSMLRFPKDSAFGATR